MGLNPGKGAMPVCSLVSLPIILPLVSGTAAVATTPRTAARLAVMTHLVLVAITVLLVRAVLEQGTQACRIGGWSAPLGIELRADGLAVMFLGATSLVQLGVCLYARSYFPPGGPAAFSDGVSFWFWPLELFLTAALNGILLGGDIFNFYVTLELLTLSAIGLIGLAGQTTALVAAMRYLFAALVGSLFYLLGVALLYAGYGTVDWQQLGNLVRPDLPSRCGLVLMTMGLVLKSALFPVHFWLPPAHASAPAPVSALLSGVVIKGSFFILLRLWFYALSPLVTVPAGQLLSALGAVAIVWGSVQAMRQERVKLMVAYSTVAQIGYLFLVFTLARGEAAMLAWRGTVYLACSHACAKAAAFAAVGSLTRSLGTDELKQWSGAARRQPASVFALALAGVSLMGLPPSGGFIGKWLLLKAALAGDHWGLALIVLLGGLLAAIYVFRVVAQTLATGELGLATRPVPAVWRWLPIALALVAIVFGLVTTETLPVLRIGAPVIFGPEVTP